VVRRRSVRCYQAVIRGTWCDARPSTSRVQVGLHCAASRARIGAMTIGKFAKYAIPSIDRGSRFANGKHDGGDEVSRDVDAPCAPADRGRRQLNKTMAGIAIRTTAALEYSYWADQLRRESVSVFIQASALRSIPSRFSRGTAVPGNSSFMNRRSFHDGEEYRVRLYAA